MAEEEKNYCSKCGIEIRHGENTCIQCQIDEENKFDREILEREQQLKDRYFE